MVIEVTGGDKQRTAELPGGQFPEPAPPAELRRRLGGVFGGSWEGGVRAGRVREGRSYPDRTVGPASPSPSHARGPRSVEFAEIRKGAGRKGAGPGAGAQGVL